MSNSLQKIKSCAKTQFGDGTRLHLAPTGFKIVGVYEDVFSFGTAIVNGIIRVIKAS